MNNLCSKAKIIPLIITPISAIFPSATPQTSHTKRSQNNTAKIWQKDDINKVAFEPNLAGIE
ncbi:Uncharacterised protein [Campylobacter jejuni]|nr:Uncharacterised protein [Campylobacter jejuni]